MAASLTIEEERGTLVRTPHPHNGYYAGDFSVYADSARPGPATAYPLESLS